MIEVKRKMFAITDLVETVLKHDLDQLNPTNRELNRLESDKADK